MGESELKIALRREAAERIRRFWQEAEAALAAKRLEVENQLSQLRAETDRRLQTEATEMSNNLLFKAQANGRKRQLLAEAELEKRLLELGKRMLPELVCSNHAAVWQALCAEVPESEWAVITVDPQDEALAKKSFPKARIDCDTSIGRGMIVANGDGSIRIDNSLRCRLLRAWPDLLPRLMTELRKKVENDEASQHDTTG